MANAHSFKPEGLAGLPEPYYHDEEAGITIYCGDCRDILPHLPKVDLVLTDPPYGIGYTPQKHNSRNSVGPRRFGAEHKLHGDTGKLDFDPTPVLEAFPGAGQVWWGANCYATALPRSRGWLVWYKADGMEATDFGHAELAWTNVDMPIRGRNQLWMGMCKKQSDGPSVHPTQKPVAVMTWCLSFFPEAQTIIDPYMGSGTTLVAAKMLGKRAIGIEIERSYCDIAIERLAQGNLFGGGQ